MGDKSITDLAGIQPIAEAGKIVVDKSTNAIGQLFDLLCRDAAAELGQAFADKVRAWRLGNANRIATKALARLGAAPGVHPAVMHEIIEAGSWVDDEGLQDLWAGLIASAADGGATDLSSRKYIDFLRRITPTQARVIRLAIERGFVELSPSGLVQPSIQDRDAFSFSVPELMRAAGQTDVENFDAEVDHLRESGLLSGTSGFSPYNDPGVQVTIIPTPLCLNFYARCMGSRSARAFYAARLKVTTPPSET